MADEIIVIGCSFSKNGACPEYPFEENHTLSWPEMLALDLPDNRVVSYAQTGFSNAMIMFILQRMLNDWDEAKLFVLQFTRPLRTTYYKDWDSLQRFIDVENLRCSTHTQVQDFANYDEFPYYEGNDSWNFPHTGVIPAWPGKLAHRGGEIKRAYELSLLHDIHNAKINEKLLQEAIMRQCIHMCEQRSVPCVAYLHTNMSVIDNSFLDFVVQRDMENFDNYTVDNGYHFGAQGNRQLVDRFIRPCIDMKTSV